MTIRKVLVYLFSTNLGEVIVILGAVLLGLHVPLLAAQIIWLNFVTDGFLVAALAMEPKEPGLLRGRLERAGGRVLDARMGWRIGWMSLIMGVVTLVLFALESDYTKASTIALTVLAMFQWFNAWNCRSSSRSIFSTTMFSNRYLVASTLLVIVLQVAAVQTPLLQTFLHTTALDLREWFILGGIALSIIGAEEVRKYIVRRTQVAL